MKTTARFAHRDRRHLLPVPLVALALLPWSLAGEQGRRVSWHRVEQGIRVEASIDSLAPPGSAFREQTPVRVRFRIVDTASGEAIPGLFPGGWMDRIPRSRAGGKDTCDDKVRAFLGGGLFGQAEVDLNVYYVLALNEDNTISVVDPLFGYGGSKLLDMVFLEAPGEDWVLDRADTRLYVTQPAVDRLAIVATDTWDIIASVPVGRTPVAVELSPDQRFAWVGTEADHDELGASGVSIVDALSGRLVAHLSTGTGPHQIVFSPDGAWALVSNGGSGTISLIDARTFKPVRNYEVGGAPVYGDWSTAAGVAYFADVSGAIHVIDPDREQAASRIGTQAGLTRLRFAPGGRLALAVNPVEDTVLVVDAARGRIVQTADVDKSPDQVAFSDELAYVRHGDSSLVYMIPLAEIGREGRPVPVIDFPGGQRPPRGGAPPSPADAIVQAVGQTAVLVANAADGVIYYYKEGMAAPMGDFNNYGRHPRAVEVVDRSLRETAPGTYETVATLGKPGAYDLVLYLDSPPRTECFRFEVNPDPDRPERRRPRVTVALAEDGVPVAGSRVGVDVTLVDAAGRPIETGTPTVLVALASGADQQRLIATSLGQGRYRAAFVPRRPGVYLAFVAAEEVGVAIHGIPPLTFTVEEEEQ